MRMSAAQMVVVMMKLMLLLVLRLLHIGSGAALFGGGQPRLEGVLFARMAGVVGGRGEVTVKTGVACRCCAL